MDINFEQSKLSDLEETVLFNSSHTKSSAEKELENISKQRKKFYEAENAKMESVLKKLGIMNQNGELNISLQAEEALNKMVELQDKLKSRNLDAVSLGLTQAEILQKQNGYIAKLQTCIKFYTNLNEKLAEEIKMLELTVEESRNQINSLCVSDDEIASLKMKAKQLENDLLKLEKRHPWLKDPKYDLFTISKEIEVLTSLREKKATLEEEISMYKGLKPNIKEANQQLAAARAEYEEINKRIFDKQGV